MDSLIAAAARSLAAGDAVAALNHVALREDAAALALRGIAMAQLGEHARARRLLHRAARTFGPREARARARCVVAEAEVALAQREITASPRALLAAADALDRRGDRANAVHARLVAARRAVLLGRLDDAAAMLAAITPGPLPAQHVAIAELVSAEIALRALRIDDATAALSRAHHAATRAAVPALLAEIADARAMLDRPAARRATSNGDVALTLADVARVLQSGAIVVDACRRVVRARLAKKDHADVVVTLARRPVLFALAHALADAWPHDVPRATLIRRAFGARHRDDSLRARLRVELGRLRKLLAPIARIDATTDGFALRAAGAHDDVIVLLPPIAGEQAALAALLGDGAAWSTSALALALGTSQRVVQRALATLARDGRVRAIGRARARRWLAPPLTQITTTLLLPVALAAD